MGWSGLAKVLSGALLAIALVIGGSIIAAQHLIAQFTAPPPKPVFPNDKPAKPKIQPAPVKPASSPTPQPSSIASAKPSPKPSAAGYEARITLRDGLNLRQGPSRDAERLDGVDYNERVVVLEESPDKEWQRIRLESGVEGWVISGYADRVNQ